MIWSLSFGQALAALGLGYVLGSIPFGLLLTRMAGGPDIRTIGSGNIGATNVLRTGRKGLAAATLLLDGLKGTAAVLIAAWLWGPQAGLAAAFGAFLGHVFPVWLGFKGGKGVATFIGCLFGAAWQVGLAVAAIWLIVAVAMRYSSLSSILSAIAAPILLLWFGDLFAVMAFGLMAVLLIVKHRANIDRLMAGTESRIGQKG
jgi:glycerol-3-phosphate acyltransferase PlsY